MSDGGEALDARFETVSFLSDYGLTDEFVGVVKSVIRSIAPYVAVVDITHAVPPYSVKSGSLTLARSVQYLCPGVVLAVVDPGVGTGRRGVAIEVGDGESYLIGPDNGLLAPAVGLVGGATAAVELNNPEYQLVAPGATFAGRDVFAPAAAYLCAGVPLTELGEVIDPASLLPGVIPLPREEDDALVGQVLWVDHYGNCQLNLGPEQIEDWTERVQLRWSGPRGDEIRSVNRSTTFEDLGKGQLGLVVDSYGLLAIAVAEGSAAELLGIAASDEVALVPLGDGPEDAPPAAQPAPVSVPVTLEKKP